MKKAAGWGGAGLQGIDLSRGSGYLQWVVPLIISGADVCVPHCDKTRAVC